MFSFYCSFLSVLSLSFLSVFSWGFVLVILLIFSLQLFGNKYLIEYDILARNRLKLCYYPLCRKRMKVDECLEHEWIKVNQF